MFGFLVLVAVFVVLSIVVPPAEHDAGAENHAVYLGGTFR